MSIYLNCSYSFYDFLMLYIQSFITYLQITFKIKFICFVFDLLLCVLIVYALSFVIIRYLIGY